MDEDLEAGLEKKPGHEDHVNRSDNDLSFRAVEPVDVFVHSLTVDIDLSPAGIAALPSALKRRKDAAAATHKRILDNVNADMPSGSLTAILGGSGSGKTTTLHALSHRISGGRLQISGNVRYNGTRSISGIESAYVMQNDVLIPTLTVRETLRYAAELRLPPPTTPEERRRVVEDVILELGLKECANTRVGNNIHKGCSGGEKRRTSLGVQMLANPSVLFLDEVTTGLDAASAFQLIKTLKLLANKGRTIIVTIHQPRSEIWGLFDHLVLLSGGATVYSGLAKNCLPHFESLGYSLPAFVNPAEFLVDLAAHDIRSPELEHESSARVQLLKQAWSSSSHDIRASRVTNEKIRVQPTSIDDHAIRGSSYLGRQISVLTARTFKITYRDPMGMAGSLIEALSMAIITGWIFYNLDGSLSGMRSRQGALYTAAALQGYLILLFEIYRLTIDIELFDREYVEGVVSVPAFLISRRLARVFMEDLPVPLLYSIIFYFMVGFDPGASQFLVFFAVNLLMHYIAVSLAMLCVSVSRELSVATLIANMAYTLQSLGCGYFVQSNQIPVWMRWLKWTAYVFYGFGAMAANEFVGHTSNPAGRIYDCPDAGGSAAAACEEYTGAYQMRSLGFPDNWITRPILVLLAFAIAFYIGAAIILRYKRVGIQISRAQQTGIDTSLGKEAMIAVSPDNKRSVKIAMHDYSLDIRKRVRWLTKVETKSILKPINTLFEPGVLNVIMGPSGAGKTSLLNVMADRLHDSVSTAYKRSGNMMFNNTMPSADVVRSICSYVCQDDDALLPCLTVRENLQFAAALRSPTHYSKIQKRQRAESVLLKMGLRDCADNLVGNELIKGISGGEKRRVTIAIQILTDPQVLIMDEPTSGLDAFTASSIVEVLKGLAEEGRTLILTIHQARSDLFQHFGNILLLARGGYPVFTGKGSDMLPHFAALGHHCPTNTNPADFALDLITVNLQRADKEAATREKVRSLILSWDNTSQQPAITQTTSHLSAPAELGSLIRSPTSFATAFPLLLHRSSLNFRRSPPALIARTTQVLGFAVILTLFFAPLQSNTYSIQTRLGFIQEFAALYFVGMLQNVAVYPTERRVFAREHEDGAYGVAAFFLQYTLLEIPFELITSLLFALLTVIAAGLPRTTPLFFIVAFNCFAIVNCGESVGIVFDTLFEQHTGFAINLTSVVLSLATVMGGVMSLNVPGFLEAWNHLSPVKWALGNLAPYTLQGVVLSCGGGGDGCTGPRTGEEVLRLYGLDKNAGLNLLALGVCVVVYRLVAWGLLEWRMRRWGWRWKGIFGFGKGNG
ncbi:MAG: hypothetical protein LQ350_001015 [Teloschistes chrysophthalmus]|nr:MAG: hypothetical protein LQ350_001015 [Niorma chrysophthalma]